MITHPLEPNGSLFIAALYRKDLVSNGFLENFLQEHVGEFLFHEPSHFPMKNYYEKEMGNQHQMHRRIFFFLNLKPEFQDCIPNSPWKIKSKTMEWEKEKFWSKEHEGRSVNLDPGFVFPENVQLLTSKPFAHRVHLSRGVYSELEYLYQGNSYQTLPWTYPDYKENKVIEFFNYVKTIV